MKKRLTENQVTRLLKKGYSYTQISLYEQALTRDDKAVRPPLPDGMTGGGGPATPEQIAQIQAQIGGQGPAGPAVPTNTDITPQTVVPPTEITPQTVKDKLSTRMGPAGPVGGIAGALGNAAAAGKVAGDLGRTASGGGSSTGAEVVPFGSFEDVVGQKIKQIQGEGYSLEESFEIFEDFAGRAFGTKFLSENNNRLNKVRFNESDIRSINEEWAKYLHEQGILDTIKNKVSGAVDTVKQGVSDFAKNNPKVSNVVKGVKDAVSNNPAIFGALGGGAIAGPAGALAGGLAGATTKALNKAGGIGNVVKGITNTASNALSKNEEMSPENNHTALRDWTTKMKESLMQEKDYDGDGKVETGSQEYLGSRDKAIKKAMAKEQTNTGTLNPRNSPNDTNKNPAKVYHPNSPNNPANKGKAVGADGRVMEKTVFYTDDKERVRKFDDGR